MYLDDPFDGVAAEAGSAVFAGYMVPRVYTVRHRQTEIKGRTSSAKDNISEGGTTETLQQTKKGLPRLRNPQYLGVKHVERSGRDPHVFAQSSLVGGGDHGSR